MDTLDSKLIVCYLPPGVAQGVVEKLGEEKKVFNTYIKHARGSTMAGLLKRKGIIGGIGEWINKELLGVVVPSEMADDIFVYIYNEAGIGKPHGGFMFMCANSGFVPQIIDI